MMQIIVCATRQWQKHFIHTFCHLLMALEQISAALPALSLGNIQALHTQAKSAIQSAKKEFEKIPRPDERQTKGSYRSWCAHWPICLDLVFRQELSISVSGPYSCVGSQSPHVLGLSDEKDFQGKRKANERYLVKKYHQEKGYCR